MDSPTNLRWMRAFTTLSLNLLGRLCSLHRSYTGRTWALLVRLLGRRSWTPCWSQSAALRRRHSRSLFAGVYEWMGGLQPQRRTANINSTRRSHLRIQRLNEHFSRVAGFRWRNLSEGQTEESGRREWGWNGEYLGLDADCAGFWYGQSRCRCEWRRRCQRV